ncbi:MAG: hydroxyacid dehydrogenase [Candidatus Moranbacteria bacterium]|nr:hydroxyacid dehydrogenase [Candidatus Moranbacteria bacterium]
MNIACFETTPTDSDRLAAALPGHELRFFPEPLTEKNADLAKDCEAISVFIYSELTEETLSKLPGLRLIATRSTGFDHIDLDACRQRDISVMNVPSYGENTVAEHTFALILALSRNVHKSYARGQKGDYSIEGLMGFDLAGRTLGVIGTGRIGMHVIRIAKGFGMHVLAFDTKRDIFLSEILHFRYAELDEVLEGADIVTLHIPLLESTRHFMDHDKISRMKRGSLLINTSRGGIIDNPALIKGLNDGILAGAGLDVIEGEEHIREENQCLHKNCSARKAEHAAENRDLLSRDNVVFTPHIGFYSQEALLRILDTTADNLRAFADGKSINTVG